MTAAFDREPNHPTERMFKWFRYDHLRPGPMQETSKLFHDLADDICNRIQPGPERTACLRNLLQAKDAAVRAVLHPGG